MEKFASSKLFEKYSFNADEVNRIFDLGLKEYRRINNG